MGGLFGKPKPKNTDKKNYALKKPAEPAKSRVNESDKAILEVKTRLKKLKTYTEKITIDVQNQVKKIQDHLKDKNKNRALMALKHKKFMEKELDKAYAA